MIAIVAILALVLMPDGETKVISDGPEYADMASCQADIAPLVAEIKAGKTLSVNMENAVCQYGRWNPRPCCGAEVRACGPEGIGRFQFRNSRTAHPAGHIAGSDRGPVDSPGHSFSPSF